MGPIKSSYSPMPIISRAAAISTVSACSIAATTRAFVPFSLPSPIRGISSIRSLKVRVVTAMKRTSETRTLEKTPRATIKRYKPMTRCMKQSNTLIGGLPRSDELRVRLKIYCGALSSRG